MTYPVATTPSSAVGLPRPLFIQFLNPEILALYGVKLPLEKNAYLQVLQIIRYGFLISRDRIILPGSYLFEVPGIDKVLRSIALIIRAGIVYIASPSATLTLYAEQKRREYRDETLLFDRYTTRSEMNLYNDLRFSPRVARSSAVDISAAWAKEMDTGGILDYVLHNRPKCRKNLSSLEKSISAVPYHLDGRAFITRFVLPFFPFTPMVQDVTKISFFISRVYLESYIDEYKAFIISDTPLGDLDCKLNTYSRAGELQKVSFKNFASIFETLGIRQYFERSLNWGQLIELRAKPIIDWFVRHTLVNHEEMKSAVQVYAIYNKACKPGNYRNLNGSDAICEIETQLYGVHNTIVTGTFDHVHPRNGSDRFFLMRPQLFDGNRAMMMQSGNTVFLVHGRDMTVVTKIKMLLRYANLNPLDWEEVVSWTGAASPSTLDVIKIGLERAQAVLILLTPDEDVHLVDYLCDSNQDPERGCQPRPNVLIELGMAVAINPNRTLLLRVGDMRQISDIAGLNFLKFNGDPASRNALVERLKIAGCVARPSSDFFNMVWI